MGVGVSVGVPVGNVTTATVLVKTAVGGTGVNEGTGVNVGGTGVMVGGTGVSVGVMVRVAKGVYVGGRNGVHEGAGVELTVAVKGGVAVLGGVTVNRFGVCVGPPVRLGKTQGVMVAGDVRVKTEVMEGVGVGVGFWGVRVQASHPMQ